MSLHCAVIDTTGCGLVAFIFLSQNGFKEQKWCFAVPAACGARTRGLTYLTEAVYRHLFLVPCVDVWLQGNSSGSYLRDCRVRHRPQISCARVKIGNFKSSANSFSTWFLVSSTALKTLMPFAIYSSYSVEGAQIHDVFTVSFCSLAWWTLFATPRFTTALGDAPVARNRCSGIFGLRVIPAWLVRVHREIETKLFSVVTEVVMAETLGLLNVLKIRLVDERCIGLSIVQF